MRLNLIPVYQWTHRQFVGPDPWAGGQLVTWEVTVYNTVAEAFLASTPVLPQSVPPESNAIPSKLSVGIFNRQFNRYRILPLALQDLFRAGQVSDRALPALLHQVEEPLRLSDYPPSRMAVMVLVYAGLVAACAVPMLLAGMGLFAAVLAAVAAVCVGIHLAMKQRRRALASDWFGLLATAQSPALSQHLPEAAVPGRAAGR